MKNLVIVFTAIFLAGGKLSAQVAINIVGSNGDRSSTQKAISNLLSSGTGVFGNWSFQGDYGAASRVSGTASGLTGAVNSNYGVWNGSFGGTNVVVRVSYIGGAGAVGALAVPQEVRFTASTGTGSLVIKNPYDSTATLGVDYNLSYADFGFSTNFQYTTPFYGDGFDTLTEEIVGVSPVVFVASPGFSGTNVTSQSAQALYGGGSFPVSIFTGSSGDQQKNVFALGRNTDSGLRYATYGEIGLGTATTVKVWQPTIVGQLTDTNNIKYGGTATAERLWPIETVSGINSGARGNGGYDTGGSLASSLTVSTTGSNVYRGKDTGAGNPNFAPYPSATAGYYIGYVTIQDYNSRIASQSPSSVLLQWNGMSYSEENVRQGAYPLWVYNRIIKPSAGLSGLVDSFHDALRDQILNVDAVENGGLRVNDPAHPFAVERYTDGGGISPTY